MKHIKQYLIIYSTLMFLLIIFMIIIFWQSPGAYFNSAQSLHQEIHGNHRKLDYVFSAHNDYHLHVAFIANSAYKSMNPYFPSIHICISSHDECDQNYAWIHIVHTDAEEPRLRTFVDSIDSIYPFYTYGKDFYDAPLWRYTLFYKPISYWKGIAFAVRIDHVHKTIECIGAIEWGFQLHYYQIRPQAIIPRMLDLVELEAAWLSLQDILPGYKNIINLK